MLLARSSVSKSSNKSLIKTAFVLGATLFSGLTLAQNANTTSVTSASSWLPMFLSLLFVIAIIFAVAFIVKKFTGIHSSSGQIRSVASLMVGTRERIAVIQVGEEQHLVGVTAHNINHLAKLEQPLTESETNDKLKTKFATLLQIQSSTQEKQ